MKKIVFSFLAIGLLGACSTMVNHQTQYVTVKTPGASNAHCILENQDMKYVAFSNQKIEMMNSPHDLIVRCQAEGNREQTVLVKRDVDEWVIANVANGFVPGAAYDYFSRGAFTYPETITVSFIGVPVKPYPLPKYMAKDVIPNAQNSQIEYMGPGQMITESNKYDTQSELKKKTNSYGVSPEPTAEPVATDTRPTNLYRQYNPAVYDPAEEDK